MNGTKVSSERLVEVNYAATFEERLFGVKCDVEIVVNLSTGDASVIAGMRQALGLGPACHISIDDLRGLAASIREVNKFARLLDKLVIGATDHQLNCSVAGTTLIIVKPQGKPARFTLTIGLFHKEGLLEDLSTREVDDAIAVLEGLQKQVLAQIRK